MTHLGQHDVCESVGLLEETIVNASQRILISRFYDLTHRLNPSDPSQLILLRPASVL